MNTSSSLPEGRWPNKGLGQPPSSLVKLGMRFGCRLLGRHPGCRPTTFIPRQARDEARVRAVGTLPPMPNRLLSSLVRLGMRIRRELLRIQVPDLNCFVSSLSFRKSSS